MPKLSDKPELSSRSFIPEKIENKELLFGYRVQRKVLMMTVDTL